MSAGVQYIHMMDAKVTPAEVEEKSFPTAFFDNIYSIANLVCSYLL